MDRTRQAVTEMAREDPELAAQLVPAVDLTFLSSSIVREVARYGGDVSHLVHPAVASALAERFRQ